MRQLLYVSDTAELSTAELDAIVTVARRNNQMLGLTGLLIHGDGGFLQLLEGDERAVRDTYGRICADTRHRDPRLLLDRESPRGFAGWSMGFEQVQENDPETAGLFGVMREARANRLSPGAGRIIAMMLETFYRVRRDDALDLAKAV
jgi:Sensors of blue-light using FAD